MTFQPGVSGNPGGRRAEKPFRQALLMALKDDEDAERRRTKLDKIVAGLIAAAEAGETPAIKEIADRLDGKPAQTQIHQGDDDGGAIQHEHRSFVVNAPSPQA